MGLVPSCPMVAFRHWRQVWTPLGIPGVAELVGVVDIGMSYLSPCISRSKAMRGRYPRTAHVRLGVSSFVRRSELFY